MIQESKEWKKLQLVYTKEAFIEIKEADGGNSDGWTGITTSGNGSMVIDKEAEYGPAVTETVITDNGLMEKLKVMASILLEGNSIEDILFNSENKDLEDRVLLTEISFKEILKEDYHMELAYTYGAMERNIKEIFN